MEIARDKKIVRMMVGEVKFMFYHLDLHQEFWRLRPVENFSPLIEERAGILPG